MAERPSITCPRCRMTSYNKHDIEQGYCGKCHDWTGRQQRNPYDMLRLDNLTRTIEQARAVEAKPDFVAMLDEAKAVEDIAEGLILAAASIVREELGDSPIAPSALAMMIDVYHPHSTVAMLLAKRILKDIDELESTSDST